MVLLVVDGRAGMAAGDRDIARRLRRLGKPVRIAVNKTEGLDPETAVPEFFDLGLGTPLAISSPIGRDLWRSSRARWGTSLSIRTRPI